MPNTTSIDDTLLQHLGELARLHVPPERRSHLRSQLQRIVDAFSSLASADLGPLPDDERTAGPSDLRDDAAEAAASPAEVLANAPEQAADQFVVPRVVDA
ncbi:MAG: Asp-tRNA(Asn)/Glu-tRNA(Gln) amidotransferase subunit GatC [Planctomycetota bacterium]